MWFHKPPWMQSHRHCSPPSTAACLAPVGVQGSYWAPFLQTRR